jgi:hypothetical protein
MESSISPFSSVTSNVPCSLCCGSPKTRVMASGDGVSTLTGIGVFTIVGVGVGVYVAVGVGVDVPIKAMAIKDRLGLVENKTTNTIGTTTIPIKPRERY